MSKQKEKEKPEEKRRADAIDTVQPPDPNLAAFIAAECKHEQPNWIDVYPLTRRGDKLERLKNIPILPTERVDAERAGGLTSIIWSSCQVHCDSRPGTRDRDGSHQYLILIISEKRGGIANPVGTYSLRLYPRAFRPAPVEGDGGYGDSGEDGEALTARKMMIESVKLVHERERDEQQNQGKIVGETMLVLKGSLVDREQLIRDLFAKNIEMINQFLALARQVADNRVAEKAIEIEAADAKARRDRENLLPDVARAGMLETITQLGKLFPSFGRLIYARLTGQPVPDPPQLSPGENSSATTQPSGAEIAGAEEKRLINRFVDAAKARRVDSTHTAEERLFGRDDDAGNPIEEGVFTREQVAILSGFRTGKLPVEALDALIPDSGKPEAITEDRLMRAIPYLNPEMLADLGKFLTLRKSARATTN